MTESSDNDTGQTDGRAAGCQRRHSTVALVAALVAAAAVLGIASGVVLANLTTSVAGVVRTIVDRLPEGAHLTCTAAGRPSPDDVPSWDAWAPTDFTCTVADDLADTLDGPLIDGS